MRAFVSKGASTTALMHDLRCPHCIFVADFLHDPVYDGTCCVHSSINLESLYLHAQHLFLSTCTRAAQCFVVKQLHELRQAVIVKSHSPQNRAAIACILDPTMELAAELEAAFDALAETSPSMIANASPELVDSVMCCEDLVHVIQQYVSIAQELGATCKCWDRVHQFRLRAQSRSLLECLLPRELGFSVEAALFARTGGRAGPGEYNTRLRRLLLNLRANEELRLNLIAGVHTPALFVAMEPADLATSAQKAEMKRLEAEQIESAKRVPPAADVSGIYHCDGCHTTKQWIKRFVRAGDVTKYSEVLICCECKATVDPRRAGADLWLGTGIGAGTVTGAACSSTHGLQGADLGHKGGRGESRMAAGGDSQRQEVSVGDGHG